MSLSRRRFLSFVGFAGSGVLDACSRPVQTTGQPTVFETLLAVTITVIRSPIDTGHYLDYFTWRAEHLPAHRTLYNRFCADIDQATQKSSGQFFARAPADTRKAVLRQFSAWNSQLNIEPRPRVVLEAVAADLEHRKEEYSQFIIEEILALYASTDAWLVVGYESWPGVPLGADISKAPVAMASVERK